MNRHKMISVLGLLATVVPACAGSIGREAGGGAGPDGGPGKPAVDLGATPAFKDGGQPAPKPDLLASTPDKGLSPDQWQPPPVKPDQFVPLTGCSNGNLLAAYPNLPKLCRPFPASTPGPVPKEPSSCSATPQKTLSAGADQFTGVGFVKDWIRAMDGDDILKGMECSDIMNGNVGNDWLNGNKGNDELHGGAGKDTIHGGADNDRLYGDLDSDTLSGALGDDQYFFAQGEGYDTVQESGGYDSIVCVANAGRQKAKLLSWHRQGNDLLLVMSGGTTVRVNQHYAAATYSIDAIIACQ